ncbi:MAG: hypothetical protein ACRBDI_06390 [Alphaproteobacteria bacterium]
MHSINNMYKNKKALWFGAALISIIIGVSSAYVYNKTTLGDAVRLSLKDFPRGAKVEYQILSDGTLMDQGSTDISKNGVLDLVLPKTAKTQKDVDYHLMITPDNNEAQMLDLLLNVDTVDGEISIKGSGLEKFTQMNVKNGTDENKFSADWSGGFSAAFDKQNNHKGKKSQAFEMAFQNSGIESDVNAFGNGKIEVFLGEDLDYGVNEIRQRYGGAINSMTTQISAAMVQQTMMIGSFMDASMQMTVQRKIQELQARAHKDYHPSEQMCRFGTFMRSVATSERKSEVDKRTLNRILMDKYLGGEHSSTGGGPATDSKAIIARYADLHCDSRDNNDATAAICEDTADTQAAREQRNKDIDYTRTLAGKLTLDINFADGFSTSAANTMSSDEHDLLAMARNLYFPDSFEVPKKDEIEVTTVSPHFDSRSYAAKMNVAHTSFVNIVGMKSSAPVGRPTATTTTTPAPPLFGTGVNTEPSTQFPGTPAPQQQTPPYTTRPAASTATQPSMTTDPLLDTTGNPRQLPEGWRVLNEDSGWAYMKALMMEFGITDENGDGNVHDEIDRMLGERPSYYAQMEVLTKKIYQNPNFYTNLYDKPANVERIGASIDAITLMNQRDRFESMLRQEMLSAVLVEEALKLHVENVNTQIYEVMQQNQMR